MADKVMLYTDGACAGNPGPGGWCAILVYGKAEKVLSGGSSATTNNRMELTAVIEGLKALKRPCDVTVVSDSQYVCDSVTKRWVYTWQSKGWKKKNTPTPNRDLWEQLLPLLEIHNVKFQWIKGHNGHPMNERCDRIAVMSYVNPK